MKDRKDKLDELLRDYYKHKRGTPEEADLLMATEFAPALREAPVPFDRKAVQPRKKEPCPSPELLAAYIDGTLDPKEKVEMHRHIERCPDCSDKVQSGLKSIQEYREGNLEKTDEKLSSDTSSKLDDYYRKGSTPPEKQKSP